MNELYKYRDKKIAEEALGNLITALNADEIDTENNFLLIHNDKE